MAIILGIDPGSRVTGFGVIEIGNGRASYLASGCIRTTLTASVGVRLKEIHEVSPSLSMNIAPIR